MKNRIIMSVVAIFAIIAAAIPAKGETTETFSDGTFQYQIADNLYWLPGTYLEISGIETGMVDKLVDVEIPETIEFNGETYTIGAIGYRIFVNIPNLRTLTLPPSMADISYNIQNCPALEAVNMSKRDDVPLICQYSFNNCDRLRTLVFPANTHLQHFSICGCESLTSVTFENGGSMGCESLSSLPNLEEVNITGQLFMHEYNFMSLGHVKTIDLTETGNDKIGDSSFSFLDELEEIWLPKDLKEVYNSSFTCCPNLKRIYCPVATPPYVIPKRDQLGTDFGSGTNFEECLLDKTAITLYVPTGAAEAYRSDPGWCNFPNIVEYEFSSVESVDADLTADDVPVEYYDLTGRAVTTPSQGIYIRRQGTHTDKVVIR